MSTIDYQVPTMSETESEPDYDSDYDSDTQQWPDAEQQELVGTFEAHLQQEQQMAADLTAAIDRLFQADPDWTPENTTHAERHSTCPDQASDLIWLLYKKIEMPVLQTLIRTSFAKWDNKWTKFLISAYQRRKMGETELNPRRVKEQLQQIMKAPTKRKREETPAKCEETPTKRAKCKPKDILQAYEEHPETQDMPDWAVRVYVARKTAHYKLMNSI